MKMNKGVSDEGLERIAKTVKAQEEPKTRNNAYLSSHDPIITIIYDAEETIDLFGEDQLEEYGTYVPEDLIQRYKAASEAFNAVQTELDQYRPRPR